MRVLQICHKSPFPPNDGGTLAMYQLSKAMLDMGWMVQIVYIGTTKHPIVEMPLDAVFQKTNPIGVNLNTTPTLKKLIQSWISENNYLTNRFYHLQMENLIVNTLKENTYDMVIFEGTYTAMYLDGIRDFFTGITVLRAHNIEYQLWDERLLNEKNGLKKLLLKPAVKQLQNFELSELKKFDVVAAISMGEKAFFNSYIGLNHSVYVPFGISLPQTISETENEHPKLVFLGSLDWEPNLDGLRWFLEEVWPLVCEKERNVEFHIAGRNAPAGFEKSLPQDCVFHGEVDDAHEFISSGTVFIVPLLAGSGIRIKIIEALALGQVICTTAKGASGIPAQNEVDLFIADSARQMARHISTAIRQPNLRLSMAQKARKLAEKEFDVSNTQKALLDLVKTYKK